MKIYCCECKEQVFTNMVTGQTIYPHRPDLWDLVIYQCPKCKNYVGTHKKSGIPLGVIATSAIKKQRMLIHNMLDPLWKTKRMRRQKLYNMLSKKLGYKYHTANIKSLRECKKVKKAIQNLRVELGFKKY